MYRQIKKILSLYKIKIKKIYPPQSGYRNKSFKIETKDGKDLNLIFYKQEPNIIQTIRNANYVSDYLAGKNFPTRQTITYGGRSIVQLISNKKNQSLNTKTKKLPSKRQLSNNLAIKQNSQPSTQNSKLPIIHCALNTYLPGQTIPWETYTMKHLKLLGKTMSDMHFALKDLPQSSIRNFKDEMIRLNRKMSEYLVKDGVKRALFKKLGLSINTELKNQRTNYQSPKGRSPSGRPLPLNYKLSSPFENLFTKIDKEPKHPLHMDFVRSNILFEKETNSKSQVTNNNQNKNSKHHALDIQELLILNSQLKISGILDFEKTLYGPPILDIARTLAFLLVDCKYKHPEKIYKYFLYSGYKKKGENNINLNSQPPKGRFPSERLSILNSLTTFFLLYDFYKFLAYNVYEGLEKNEHFVRTRDILIKRKILTKI